MRVPLMSMRVLAHVVVLVNVLAAIGVPMHMRVAVHVAVRRVGMDVTIDRAVGGHVLMLVLMRMVVIVLAFDSCFAAAATACGAHS